jgi:hypothetical protein
MTAAMTACAAAMCHRGAMVVCDFCGTTPPGQPAESRNGEIDHDDRIPLTWVTSVENGRQRVYCDRCAREHLRSIESKLDAEWW